MVTLPTQHWLKPPSHCTPRFISNSTPPFIRFHKETPQNSVWFAIINLLVYSKVSSLLPLSSFLMFLWWFPGTNSFRAHPSFRLGLKFRNHQTCWAWMGAHLPYGNMYHKGIYPFVEQTHHYTPAWWDWLFVLMGGSFLRSKLHLHPFRMLTPSLTVHFPLCL